MKPWTNTHTVAVLWLIAACLAIGWIAGLVSIREQALQWGSVTPPKPHHQPSCKAPLRAIYCP